MKRLLDDDMELMTQDESERLWRELELASMERRRVPKAIVWPLALGATAVGAVVVMNQTVDDRLAKSGARTGNAVPNFAELGAPPTGNAPALALPSPTSADRLTAMPYLDGPSGTSPKTPPHPTSKPADEKRLRDLPYIAYSAPEVNVTGTRTRLERESSTTKQKIGKEDLESLPGDTYQEATTLKSISPPPQFPSPTSTGGTDPVNGEARDATFYESAGVNPFIDTEEDALATFAMDVDNASFTIARSYLRDGALPPPASVRAEEFVNAIRHDYAPPVTSTASTWAGPGEREDFAIHLDAAPSPFGKGLTLLRVGLKARDVAVLDRKPCTLTFVIDVSGSMNADNRLGLVKQALGLLLDQMDRRDEVGIVVYGSEARVVLPPTSLAKRADIVRAIDWLRPEGSTNVQAGLREGYRMADEAMRPGRVNRIILCSDGVANNGLTEGDAILDEVRREARRGIELTAVGFGMSNYNDVLMEKLADHGDGSYWYVDRLEEARRIFVESMTGTLETVARQAKVQVEFDPSRVERYRLIGYENRDVADRDFRNDAVDAGEVGAGHEVTALFELKARDPRPSVESPGGTGALATVRIRYEDPDTRKVREVASSVFPADVLSEGRRLPAGLALDAAVAEFAEVLRHSFWSKESSPGAALSLAREAVNRLGEREDRLELIGMMETADRLWPAERRQGWRDDEKPDGE